MYLSIIVLPLLGCIVSGFFGRKVGVTGSRLLSCLCIILTTILAIIGFFEVGFNNNQVSINLFRWLHSESFNMEWNFQFDSLTVSMLIPVLIISSLVHIYSIGYMSHDPHNQRFFSYLSLFTFMMIILVTGNNYLLMFVGWEGVGVCSYLLVSFWFTRIAANQSSLAAFLTNRVGDCFLTIGMFVILWSQGSLDYNVIFSLAPYINENVITMIGICLLIGAMAKSSQVGLHIWLPMAIKLLSEMVCVLHIIASPKINIERMRELVGNYVSAGRLSQVGGWWNLLPAKASTKVSFCNYDEARANTASSILIYINTRAVEVVSTNLYWTMDVSKLLKNFLVILNYELAFILDSYKFNLQVEGSIGEYSDLSGVLYCKNSSQGHSTVDTIAGSPAKASSPESPDEQAKKVEELHGKATKILQAQERNEESMDILEKAFILESILPEQALSRNSHLNELKKEYPSCNDEDPQKNLRNIRDHLLEEYGELARESSDLKSEFSLAEARASERPGELNEDTELSSTKKRENTDSESSPNKRPRKDDDQDNGKSGPSAAAAGGQGPSSSQGGGDNSSCSRNSDQANSSDRDQTYILNIIVKLIKALCGDDEDYMD